MGSASETEPVGQRHDISRFISGVSGIESWLQSKARLGEAKGGARTYAVCDGERVVGFYSLAASSVERRSLSSRLARNLPEPVPVILLGQLAVDTRYRSQGLGSDLLIDAAGRSLAAADVIGARAIVVHAPDERAKSFYAQFGFRPFSNREPLVLVLRISELRALLAA